MTDITELAQRMKAAAEKATQGEWRRASTQFNGITATPLMPGRKEVMIAGASEKRDAEFIALANPANVLALVEALEKAQAAATQQGNIACALLDEVTQLRRHADEKAPELRALLIEADSELEVLRQRIAELESRTVTIEPFRSFVTDADLAALHRFAECCDDPESGGHDLEKEQVRRLEAIGALQRSGRISYITGFGNVLISITAGIKWEAE